MKIGIIGAGAIGSTLARAFARAGHEVALANSQDPSTIADVAAETGAHAVLAADAVKGAHAIVLTIPLAGFAKLAPDLFANVPADVPVIDTTNYYPVRDGQIEALDAGLVESLWVSQQIGRPVFKAFNSISAHSLAHRGVPAGTPGRIALPVAGDDPRGIAVAAALVDAAGFDAVEAGGIDTSWRQQPGTPVYCTDLDAERVAEALLLAVRDEAPVKRDEAFAAYMKRPADTPPDAVVASLRETFGAPAMPA